MSAIDLRDLRVVYRQKGVADRVALDGYSLESDHELLALLGPNGAGKSTLMGVIAQTIEPETGERISPISRQGLSMVFQSPALDTLLTVRENLRLSGALHGVPSAETDLRIDDLAQQLRIDDRLDDLVRSLSGGLARRADLARALVPHPTLLLLDEPTTGLDIDSRRSFWDSMQSIRERLSMTVLVATHLIDEAERADRVAMLSQGRDAGIDTPSNLRDSLGDRVLRVFANDSVLIDQAAAWLESVGCDCYRIDQTLLSPHAQDLELQSCPVEGVSITLAPPSLEDVYSIHTHAGIMA